MLPEQRKTKKRDHRKNQGFARIKQELDRNRTEIGRQKVAKVDYNTVVPYYILIHWSDIYSYSVLIFKSR